MSIWTRIAEALASIGESVGAFLQSIVNRNPTPPEKSVAFTIGMIGLGAKMAKADGVVTADEVQAFRRVVEVPADVIRRLRISAGRARPGPRPRPR